MNICKKLASFALLASLVGLSLLCNVAPSHAETNDEAITYDAATKTVTIQGDCDTDQIRTFMTGTASQAETLHFASTPTITTKQTNRGPFQGCTSLKYITADEAARVSFAGNGNAGPSLFLFFLGCFTLTSLDGLSSWDVSKVTNMDKAFIGCTELTSLDGLSSWDVSKVTNMGNMFNSCSGLTSFDGLSSWDVSKVTNMSSMFDGCSALTSLDGLSAWDVSGVSGEKCMQYMFCGCSSLIALDGLSAWDVSGVSGEKCMQYMFYNCGDLVSIDALSSWNIQNALQSTNGIKCMFGNANGITISSLIVSSTFTLSDDMFKNDSDQLPTANWWPVYAANPSSVAMAGLVAASQNTADNGRRWQRCADGTTENPMQTITTARAAWPQNTDYTGYWQTFTPILRAQVNGASVQLKFGEDFYVTYQKLGENKETTSIKDAGIYTATPHIRGKYIYNEETVSRSVGINSLDLKSDTYDLACYCAPNTYAYTGYPCTPRTMIKLHIGEGRTPSGETYQRYSFLPEESDTEGRDGDYSVAYTNNTYPGTATAKVSPANGNLINETQATFTITGDPVPAKVLLIAGAGHFSDGSSTKELSTTAGATLLQSDVETPVREGYDFTGWKDATGATITFPYVVASESVSLTASWKASDTPASQDGWNQSDAGWQYAVDGEYVTGWIWIDDEYGAHWYYFNEDTYMACSQWQWDEANSSWYWLCSSGPMIQGLWQWIDNEWYGFWWNGKMCRGWVWDVDWQKWFYCYNNGIMARSRWVSGRYWVNNSGIWIR